MKGPADLAKGWIAKAESDLANTRTMLAGPGPYDTACFHYDNAFWPTRQKAAEALAVAERVRYAILPLLPPEAKP